MKKENIIDIQKSIYTHMKKKASSYEGGQSPDLKKYARSQKKYSQRDFEISNITTLLSAIEESDVIYLGDFHTFDQNSRNLERIIRTLIKRKKKFSIGVEFVHQKYQSFIDDFLAHEITEIEFLESVDYHDSWRFPWSHYRSFFDFARKYNLKIVALNTAGTLPERDLKASEIIAEVVSEDQCPMLVLFGELHIVPNKLPALVKKKLKGIQQTVIHQNLDEVYWKLSSKTKSNKDHIVKFNDFEFSLQTSPPWIKYESMIYWYENLIEDPDFDIHDYVMNIGLFQLNSNVPENFLFLAKKIQSSLKIEADEETIEDFNIYDHGKLQLVLDKIARFPEAPISNFYKKQVEDGRVFRLPFSNNYYCSSYSINRISFIAGLHLQDINLRKRNINYERVLIKGDQASKFIYFLHQTLMGYFASKIINPFRKCDLYLDLRTKYMSPKTDKTLKETLRVVLNVIEWDGTISLNEILKGKSLYQLYQICRPIGFYLADTFYEKGISQGRVKIKQKMDWVLQPDFHEDIFFDFLRTMLPEKEFRKHKKRLF